MRVYRVLIISNVVVSSPNTPPDTCGVSGSDMCNADGTYNDNMLCSNAIIGSISYAEFVGIMLGECMIYKIFQCICTSHLQSI